MFTFTAQHVLVMRLITQYDIPSPTFLHNFLFLASAESLEHNKIGFYDFIKTKNGTFSPTLHLILNELYHEDLLNQTPFKLTEKGLERYYALASVLKYFEDYINSCFTVYMKNKEDFNLINRSLKYNIRFRRAKYSQKLF